MALGADKSRWLDMRIKQLDLIQNAISRMSNNSASLKSYCMTLMAGIIALSTASKEPKVLVIALPMVAIFAILDASYLRLERGFRSHYDHVRKSSLDEEPDFLVTPTNTVDNGVSESLLSWSILGFYGTIITLMTVLYFFQR